jgi:hypothetical protein
MTTTPQRHGWHRATNAHVSTPQGLRHLDIATRPEVGWTVKLTTKASYDIEPKTATPTGVIQLDGLVTSIDDRGLKVAIFWVQPAGFGNLRHRATPVVQVSYDVNWDAIAGMAGHPPTMWLATSTETLQESAKQAARQHHGQTSRPPDWWAELGDLG